MKRLSCQLFLLFFVSCSSVRVTYDYEKETDFSNYNTYNFYPDMQTGLSEFDQKRLYRVLDIVLQRKGLLFSEEPDFLINIQSRTFEGSQNSSVGLGVGGGGRNSGGGVSVGIPIGSSNIEREIVFDFVDTKKDMLFWQAVSISPFKESVSPEMREQKLRELVEKVFLKYPPKSKK